MTSLPKTSDEATKVLQRMEQKRAAAETLLSKSAERRKEYALAAELGDATAAESLKAVGAEDAAAAAELQNLAIAIAGMKDCRKRLEIQELAAIEIDVEKQRSDLIDQLLDIDDQIDDACEVVRDLFARRDELRAHRLLNGLTEENTILGRSLEAYFNAQLSNPFGRTYAQITRVAEWDAKRVSRKSPRMIERGPRKLTPFEESLLRAADTPSWIANAKGGHDSTLIAQEHAKQSGAVGATGLDAQPFDVSGGMMRNVRQYENR